MNVQENITNKPSDGIGRRAFFKKSGIGLAALAGTSVAPYVARGVEPTADPVRLGHIGTGVRGGQLVRFAGSRNTAKVVAVCDVYKPHLRNAVARSNNPDVKAYHDYRNLLADPNVEAVVIATPDHWHEKMVLDAVAAGKDIFCEKGWAMSIAEAKRMREAVRQKGIVMQLGHQGREHVAGKIAGDRIREGAIGEVTLVNTGRYFNGTWDRVPWRWYGWYSNWERPDPEQVRRDVDWESWLGPAPKIEWNERHFWHWRCYWAYGTGQAGDLLSHELDYVQGVLRYGIPESCVCTGHNAFWKDDRETPDTWMATYVFEDKNCTVSFEGCMSSRRGQPPEFIGRDGRIVFNRIGQDATRFEQYGDENAWRMSNESRLDPVEYFAPGREHRQRDHMDDFLHCVRTREKPRCDEDESFIETAVYMMSVKSYFEKRQVRWDKENEEIV